MSTPRNWVIIGAVLAGLGVVFGAFGAHGLEGRLEAVYGDATKSIAGLEVPATYKYLRDFSTAAEYQIYHAFGLIALGLVARTPPARGHLVAAWCFVLGIVLFSGSLYVLVLTGMTKLGMITPLGGLLMIVAWIGMALGCRATQPVADQ